MNNTPNSLVTNKMISTVFHFITQKKQKNTRQFGGLGDIEKYVYLALAILIAYE